MGVRGPVPSRSGTGHRTTQARREAAVETVVEAGEGVRPPEPDPEWHPTARLLWDGVVASAQRRFYEPSDWAVLFFTCENVSYYLAGKHRSGQFLAALNSYMTGLLLTEGDRRRAGLEVRRVSSKELESAGVTEMRRVLEARRGR